MIKRFFKKSTALLIATLMSMSAGIAGVASYVSASTVRGDFSFTKKDEANNTLSNVLFSITDGTETHYFVTDSSGFFTSDASATTTHTTSNANGNDDAVTVASDGTISVDESKLNSECGIWFGDGTVDTSEGALPAGKYTITEIRTSANEGYTLVSFTVTISEEGTVDSGTIVDKELSVTTDAYVTGTDSKIATASSYYYVGDTKYTSSSVYITDEFDIENVESSSDYYVKLVLYDKDTGKPYEDQNGNTYSVTSDTLTSTSGGNLLDKSLYFSDVNLEGAEGKELVIFLYLYDADTGMCIYEKEDLDDTRETIYVAEMTTEAVSAENSTHMGNTTDSITITDTVSISNVSYGTTYVLIGGLYLYDDDESQATALGIYDRTYISASTLDISANLIGSGTATLSFTVDSSEYDGKNIVIRTQLYALGNTLLGLDGSTYCGRLIATEVEATEETETIHFADISTSAIDVSTGTVVGNAHTDADIKDTVSLSNLVVGETYRLTATVKEQKEDGTEGDTVGTSTTVFTLSSSGAISLSSSDSNETASRTSLDSDGAAGDYKVTVTVDDISGEQGDTYVVYELLEIYSNGTYYTIGEHESISDESQTIHYPEVDTEAEDSKTADSVGTVSSSSSIVDTFYFENLVPGETYTIEGKLYDRTTGSYISGATTTIYITIDAEEETMTISGGKSETYELTNIDDDDMSADGWVTVTFSGIDSEALAGDTIVVLETLTHKSSGTVIATHSDTTDADQSIHYLYIDTEASDLYTSDHVGTVWGNLIKGIRSILGLESKIVDNLIDEIAIENLVPGETYVIEGVICDSDGNEISTDTVTITVSENGNSITIDEGNASVSVDKYDSDEIGTDATIAMSFDVDTSELEGDTAVAYTYIYHANADTGTNVLVASHTDSSDADESIYYVEIDAHAVDSQTLDHVGATDEASQIIDTIELSNLVYGEDYTVLAYAVCKEGFTDEDGYTYDAGDVISDSANTSFEASSSTKTLSLTLDIDSSLLAGNTVVVYVEVYHGTYNGSDNIIITYNDIYAYEQSIYYPGIDTSAADGDTTDDVGAYTEDGSIVDTVSLKNLAEGYSYTLVGSLWNQETGIELSKYETEATISIAKGGTVTLSDGASIISSEYDEDNGSIDLEIAFTFADIDTTVLSGQTLVVFERLYHAHEDCESCWTTSTATNATDILVAEHADLSSTTQTVHYTDISTSATDTDTGSKVGSIWGSIINWFKSLLGATDADGNGIDDDKQQNIADTLTIENLVPGKTYTVSGTLMDADTEEEITIDGKTVTFEATFTVSEDGKSLTVDNGTISNISATYIEDENSTDVEMDVVYSFDSSLLENVGTTIVIYEELLHNGKVAAQHKDIDDEDQTVNEISISAEVVDTYTKDHVGAVISSDIEVSSITDTVTFEKLVEGESYTVICRLVDQTASSDEELVFITDEDEKEVSATITFTASSDDETLTVTSDDGFSVAGSINAVLTFANELIQGKAVTVITEVYSSNGTMIAAYGYSYDEDGNIQAEASAGVYYPTAKTNATGTDTDVHMIDSDSTSVTDTVYVQNMVVGEEYTISAALVFAKDFEDYDEGDTAATGSVTFTAGTDSGASDILITTLNDGTKVMSGYVTVTISIDASELAGATLVVTEDIVHANVTVLEHDDTEDAVQTIKIADISTTTVTEDSIDEASSRSYSDTDGYTWRVVTLTTTVSYSNLWTQDELDEMAEDALTILDGDVEDLRDNEVFTISEYATYAATVYLVYANTGEKVYDSDGNTVTATVIFTANASSGTVDVSYTIDFADFLDEDGYCYLENKSLTAYTDVYQINTTESKANVSNGSHIGDHKVLADDANTVNIPKITSSLKDAVDGDTDAWATTNVSLLDTVSYENLTIGNTYTFSGTLYVAETGEKALDDNGKEITAEYVLTCTAEDGNVELSYGFDGDTLEGLSLVSYVTVTRSGIEVAVHADITDVAQTVYLPKITTEMTDSIDGIADALASDEIVLIDTVTYENLIPKRTYVATGILYDQSTGEPILDDDGEEIIATTEFTPSASDGTIDIKYTFSGTTFAGKSVVSYVTLTRTTDTSYAVMETPKTVADHTELTDEAQTVDIPSISTSMLSDEGSKMALADDEITLIDTVTYENLIVGNTYTVTGTLYIAETVVVETETSETTDDTATDSDEGTSEDTASDTTDDTETEDETDDATTSDDNVEETSDTDDEDTEEEDVNEETTQTLEETTASDGTEDTDTTAEGTETEYETVASGKALDDNGDAITATATFTATSENGTVKVTYTFSGVSLAGKTVVSYEELANNTGKTVALHEDITDSLQTIYIPDMDTTATDSNGSKYVTTAATGNITDTIYYENVVAGEEYTASGVLVDEDGNAIKDSAGEEVTTSTTFTAEDTSGYVTLTFAMSADSYYGTAVAFDEITENSTGSVIAQHKDIDDEDQSVYLPRITTSLADDEGSKELTATDDMTLVDTVTYTDLEVGSTYKVYGTLMSAATGDAATDEDGRVITAEAEFIAETTDGTVEVTYTFDGADLDGDYVAFEKLYLVYNEETESYYAHHEDISDADQTVSISMPKTGDTSNVFLWTTISFIALTYIITIILLVNKRNKSER